MIFYVFTTSDVYSKAIYDMDVFTTPIIKCELQFIEILCGHCRNIYGVFGKQFFSAYFRVNMDKWKANSYWKL